MHALLVAWDHQECTPLHLIWKKFLKHFIVNWPFGTGFLTSSTIDILVWTTLCCWGLSLAGCSEHPWLCPQDASNSLPLWDKNVPRHSHMRPGEQNLPAPVENYSFSILQTHSKVKERKKQQRLGLCNKT